MDLARHPEWPLRACADNDEILEMAFSKKIADQQWVINNICYGGENNAECPIRQLCLSKALKGDTYGVWGGTTRTYRLELIALTG